MPLNEAYRFHIETFVPLYLTNTCHANCKICNMRKGNKHLNRISPNLKKISEQLSILKNVEKIEAVCLLTGEYTRGSLQREEIFQMLLDATKCAFSMGFGKVYLGAGALTDGEMAQLSRLYPGNRNLVLSLFQETYDRDVYARFFGGGAKENPKEDFEYRRSTPKRWLEAGFSCVDIGILLGLKPPNQDICALITHARELIAMGADVAISLPRIIGIKNTPELINELVYSDLVKRVSMDVPEARVVITTRESLESIKSLLPWVGIVSPGSSDILPYTYSGEIPNNVTTSQFQVRSTRPRPSWILIGLELPTGSIQYFDNAK